GGGGSQKANGRRKSEARMPNHKGRSFPLSLSALALSSVFAFLLFSVLIRAEASFAAQQPKSAPNSATRAPAAANASSPTVAEAREFIDKAEKQLLDLWIEQQRAQWVADNFITDDTEMVSASADRAVKAATADLAQQARRFDGLKLPDDVARKILL